MAQSLRSCGQINVGETLSLVTVSGRHGGTGASSVFLIETAYARNVGSKKLDRQC